MFGERALAVYREFAEIRYRLLPYLQRVAEEASEVGLPMLRPLLLEFPDDPGCRPVDLQYMLGPDLLVCPVFSESPNPVVVDVYLPEGGWVDWWTDELVAGGRWLKVTVPLERLPLYRREGAVIEMGPVVQHTGQLSR